MATSLQEALASVGGNLNKLIGGTSGIFAPGMHTGQEGTTGIMNAPVRATINPGETKRQVPEWLDERYVSTEKTPTKRSTYYDIIGDDGRVWKTAQQQYEEDQKAVTKDVNPEYDSVLAAFQAKYPGYAQVSEAQVKNGQINAPGRGAGSWVDPSKVVYDPEYGLIAPASSAFGYAGKEPTKFLDVLKFPFAPVLAVMGGAAAFMAMGGGAAAASGAGAAAAEGGLSAIPAAFGPTSAGLVDAASLTGVTGGVVPSVAALGETGVMGGVGIGEAAAGLAGSAGATAVGGGTDSLGWLGLSNAAPMPAAGFTPPVAASTAGPVQATKGIIGGAFDWMNQNPIATMLIGGSLQSAFTPNAIDVQKQQLENQTTLQNQALQNQMELEEWRRQYANQNMNLSNVNLGVAPSQKPLTDSRGNPIYNAAGGIIGRL